MDADSDHMRLMYETAVKQNPSNLDAVQYLAVWHLERWVGGWVIVVLLYLPICLSVIHTLSCCVLSVNELNRRRRRL